MPDRAQRTIRIKWVRSAIGFPYRQGEVVRSLGLRRLNQVVERPDTPQIRGLVARVPHLVTIVEESVAPAWASVPEYTVRPPEVAPHPEAVAAVEAPGTEPAVPAESTAPEAATEPVPPAVEPEKKAQKPSGRAAAAKKAKPAKAAEKQTKKSGKAAPGKGSKPSKAGKK